MEIEIEFHRPEQLINPVSKYSELLAKLSESIGREQLELRIDAITAKFANESGYYFFLTEKPLKYVCVHVSLNPKDFI